MELKLEVRFKAEHNLFIFLLYIVQHSSEIKGLCLMKCSSETFQNLPYFWNKKTQTVFFSFFILSNFGFVTVDALIYVDIDQDIHCYKSKVAQSEK